MRLELAQTIVERLPTLINDWRHDSKKYPADVRAAYLFCAGRLQLLIDNTLVENPDGEREQQPSITEMGVGDVAYGIAVQAIQGKWDAAKLGPYMARFAIDYAKELAGKPEGSSHK